MEGLSRRRKYLGTEIKATMCAGIAGIAFVLSGLFKEPQQNLDCPDLIEEYENRIAQKSRYLHESAPTSSSSSSPSSAAVMKRKSSLDQVSAPNKRGRPPHDAIANRNYLKQSSSSLRTEEASAFDRGLEAEKILGATDATVRHINYRCYLCKYR
jgi:hypothetical protein